MSDESFGRTAAILGQLAFVALAAVVVYAFVGVTREGEARRRCTASCLLGPDYMGAERSVPNFALKDMKGQTVDFASYRGKVVVLNMWSKYCDPCMEEMPELAELSKILEAKPGIVLVTVSTDEGPDDVRPTLAAKAGFPKDPPFPVLFDPEKNVVEKKFGTKLYPETWIIDKKGVIRARFDGTRRWTSATMIEYLEQINGGEYCPVGVAERPDSQRSRDRSKPAKMFTGKEAKLCEGVTGG